MSKEKKSPFVFVKVEQFGDMHHISYNEARRRMEAHGEASFFEVRNLLSAISDGYRSAKTKRGQRIAELSRELAELIDADAKLHLYTRALVAMRNTIQLTNETLPGQAVFGTLGEDEE